MLETERRRSGTSRPKPAYMTTVPAAAPAHALAAVTLAAWLALAIAAICDHYKVPRLDDMASPCPDDPLLPVSLHHRYWFGKPHAAQRGADAATW